MNKKMYLVNFDWEGFMKGEFDIIINDIPVRKYFIDYADNKYKDNMRLIEYPNDNDYSVFSTKYPNDRQSPIYELSLEIPPLTFLGRGSAFNTKEGNTSAYFKYDNNTKMILIDCGSTIFSKLIEYNVLEGIKELNVCITHTHPDHIGSLGDLIFYMYYMKNIKVNLILSDKQIRNVNLLLNCQAIPCNSYNHRTCDGQGFRFINFTIDDLSIILFSNHNHCEDSTPECICIDIKNIDHKSICYTGDLSELHYIKNKAWTYCEPNKGNRIHYPIDKLINDIPEEKRKYFTLMHFDSDKTIEMAKEAGFNIAMTIDECTELEYQVKKEKMNKIYNKSVAEILRDPLGPIKEYHGIIDNNKVKEIMKDFRTHKDVLLSKRSARFFEDGTITPRYESLYKDILNDYEFIQKFKDGYISINIYNNINAVQIVLEWLKKEFNFNPDVKQKMVKKIKQQKNFSFEVFNNCNMCPQIINCIITIYTNNYEIPSNSDYYYFPDNIRVSLAQDRDEILNINEKGEYYYNE